MRDIHFYLTKIQVTFLDHFMLNSRFYRQNSLLIRKTTVLFFVSLISKSETQRPVATYASFGHKIYITYFYIFFKKMRPGNLKTQHVRVSFEENRYEPGRECKNIV